MIGESDERLFMILEEVMEELLEEHGYDLDEIESVIDDRINRWRSRRADLEVSRRLDLTLGRTWSHECRGRRPRVAKPTWVSR